MTWIEQQIDRLMRGQPAGFREVLEEALDRPSTLPEAIEALEEVQLESAEDGRMTVTVLAHMPIETGEDWNRPLQTVLGWLEDADEPAAEVLARDGMRELVRIYDELIAQLEVFHSVGPSTDAMGILRVLALYRAGFGRQRLIEAVQHPVLQDSYLWGAVFEALDVHEHPWHEGLFEALADHWPEGYAQLAFLDFANGMALEGAVVRHPFDNQRGRQALERWLTAKSLTLQGAARSAAVALGYLTAPDRDPLLRQAEDHPDVSVRIEAAAIRAQEGDGANIDKLLRWADDPRYADLAVTHLEAIGVDHVLAPTDRDPDFRAAAEMAAWLAQPTEFNRPPDELEAIDRRELNWPPTEDRRSLWLFRYVYEAAAADDERFEGVGLVGSVTFALTDEDTEHLSFEEIYGLHCAWELEMLEDDRAPPVREAKAGLRLLRDANPDL